MTLEDYITLLESPETVDSSDIADLRALLCYAPYCASARMLLLKALHKTHDTDYTAQLPCCAAYARDNRELYFLLHPKRIVRNSRTAGNDYFGLMAQLESMSRATGESFSELARRFKEARLGLLKEEAPPAEKNTPVKDEISEAMVQQHIHNREYAAAIEVLRMLNLRNPKKSSYFAVQMEFLQKALALQQQQADSK